MDKDNTFHTPGTYTLERLDWAILMFLSFGLLVLHWREVDWWRFTYAFLLPDVIGTFPGLYVYYAKRSGPHRSIPGVIHKLYNFGHCWAVVAGFCAIWWLITGGPEWAMLGFALHLAGDRSIFGNIYKPLGTAFEPVKLDSYRRFEEEYNKAGNW